jgi:ectoine hydroxylase-related dioxygenase (phytanoyl-CoA dioxygenase family)
MSLLKEAFDRDGVVLLPGLLAAEAPRLREALERAFAAEPRLPNVNAERTHMARSFEVERRIRDLMVVEPIISIMEGLLGPTCHMTSQNSLRTPAGCAAGGWHVDDDVYLPLPEDTPRHAVAPRPMIMHAWVLLSDVPSDDHGPTQVVPGSHWSGRRPSSDLIFQGQGPVSILGRPGDVYLHHNQTWHRRGPNPSGQERYAIATAYGRRWVSQRLYPFVDYRLPDHVLDGADDRLQRVLGRHPSGSYG